MIEMLIVLLLVLQAADAVLTRWIIKAGGYEMNPLLVRLDDWLRAALGTRARWAWLAVAKGGAIALILVAWAAGAWHEPAGAALLGAVSALYVVAVRRNWREWREMIQD